MLEQRGLMLRYQLNDVSNCISSELNYPTLDIRSVSITELRWSNFRNTPEMVILSKDAIGEAQRMIMVLLTVIYVQLMVNLADR